MCLSPMTCSDLDRDSTSQRLLSDFDWDNLPAFPVERFDSVDELVCVRSNWLTRLKILRAGRSSSLFPSEAQVAGFTAYLVTGQRNDTAPTLKTGSWAIPRDVVMPSDARVDFAYFPTHIAVAWLTLVAAEFRRVACRVPHFDDALDAGLRFSSLKDFRGHGYGANEEALQAAKLLALGKVFSYVRKHEGAFPRFRQAMNQLEFDIVHRYPYAGEWSQTDAFERQQVLALLRGGDALDSMIVPDIHREWRDWQFRAYRNRILTALAARYAKVAAEPLIEACTACTDVARSTFAAIKPIAVFNSRRSHVVSEELLCIKLPSLRSLVAEVINREPYLEWLSPCSEFELLRSSDKLESHIACALQRVLHHSGVMRDEEFGPSLSSLVINKKGEVSVSVRVER